MIIKLARAVVFTIALIIGIIVYFPKEEAARSALSFAAEHLRGTRIEWTDIAAADGILVQNLRVNGSINVQFSSAEFIVMIIDSIKSLAPTVHVNFKGCSVQIGTTWSLGDGRVKVSVGREGITLTDLRTNGDIALNGSMTVNPSTQKITSANVRVSVPAELEQHLNMLSSFLPLVNDGGRWYLRR